MRKILVFMGSVMMAAFLSCTQKDVPAEKGIIQVATVAQSFGDGEKVSQVIVTYGKDIDAASVSPASYAVGCVENGAAVRRTVEAVAVDGSTVTLSLAYVNKWDATGGQMPRRGRPGTDAEDGGEGKGGAPQAGAGPRFDDDGVPVDLTATVTQAGDVRATDGTVYRASDAAVASTSARELVIEDFTKHTFTDGETGITLPYFVYLPAGYGGEERYPAVFFIPDASADTSIDTATLTQGNGGTVWATPQEQEKHPAIVVAIQYPYAMVRQYGALTDDTYTWTDGLTAVHNLIGHVVSSYAVDTERIYGTGQSQGCMSNIALSDRYPGLFAAQYLVAGQWDVAEMAAMKDKKLWIVVCEGDDKAYPAMTEAVALWESLGAKVARGDGMWDPKADCDAMRANVAAMLAQDADIRFNVFAGGSHMYTWSLAYDIEGIRDWLFAQSR